MKEKVLNKLNELNIRQRGSYPRNRIDSGAKLPLICLRQLIILLTVPCVRRIERETCFQLLAFVYFIAFLSVDLQVLNTSHLGIAGLMI